MSDMGAHFSFSLYAVHSQWLQTHKEQWLAPNSH